MTHDMPTCLHKEPFMPVVYYYYDRADMPGTTPYETRHTHSLYEIMYVSDGAAGLMVGEKMYTLKRGQYVWLNADTPHALYMPANAPLSMLNVEYQFERCDGRCPDTAALCAESPEFRAMMTDPAPFLILNDADGAAALLLRQINRCAEQGQEHGARLCSYLVTQLMLLMAYAREQSALPEPSFANRYVAAAMKRIENDYHAPLTARQLAQELFICPNYLHQLFRRHTGVTLKEHLRRRRIRQAQLLLSRGDLPVSAVAKDVGIRSVQYFTRIFTEYVGVSPAAFRQRAQGVSARSDTR